MSTERVKVYEDKTRSGLPIWAWLLPLLLILALLAWYLLHRNTGNQATAAPVPVASAPTTAGTSGMPDLGTVHFATNSADLTPEDQATLTKAADYMKQHPEIHLRLEGFTDATGNDPQNLSLSERRSQAVGQFLKGQGVEASKLTGQGFGPQNPVDTNATASGKADNRRVELFQQQ